MENFWNFMIVYWVAMTLVSIIVFVVPPIRRWFFSIIAQIWAEGIELGFKMTEKIEEKFEK